MNKSLSRHLPNLKEVTRALSLCRRHSRPQALRHSKRSCDSHRASTRVASAANSTLYRMAATFFKTASSFRTWLAKHGGQEVELWVGFHRKNSGKVGMSYPEAVDEALCAGWIDGLKGTVSADCYRIRFTPRKPKSVWSQINVGHAERLIHEGRMTAAGLAQIAAAKADGRWERAYAGSKSAEVPADFLAELGKNAEATAFYKTLNKANTYAIYFRIINSKTAATRASIIQRIVAKLEKQETYH